MPTFDKVELGKKAREFGFIRDTFEKMCRLTEILRFINEDRELCLCLALRGGTAINLTILSLPRLSVDIDLDFSQPVSRDEMLSKRERINDLLKRYMASQGYSISDKSRFTHSLDSFVYSYTNAAGNPDNIKIEIDYSLRNHILPVSKAMTKTSGVFTDFPVYTVSPHEIFAGKTVALISRAAARDLYDINNMLVYELFDEAGMTLLRKCTVFYMAISGDMEKGFTTSEIDIITEKLIRTDLYPMIRNKERFDTSSAKDRVLKYISDLSELTDNETAFLNEFNKGRYKPELKFDDVAIIKRIENHPMAVWRLSHMSHTE